MATDREHLQLILRDLARSEERSPLFYWLLEHHDQIIAAQEGKRIRWAKMVARLGAAGLTDVTGKAATARTARETWYRVRKVIAGRRSDQHGPRPAATMPSKLPKSARPLVAETPASPPPALPRAAGAGAGGWPVGSAVGQHPSQSGPASDRRLTAAERTERLKQQLQSRKY